MERVCSNCLQWNKEDADGDGSCKCGKLGVRTRPGGSCPACVTPDTSAEELDAARREAEETKARLLGGLPKQTVKAPAKKAARKKRVGVAEPMLVRHDPDRPDLVPFGHQTEAIERYRDTDEVALFFEMGCGKSFTTLQIAQEKFRKGEIKGMLVVAPNDVHRQWFDELVNGVDKDRDGTLWQELQVDFEAQCVGGRGGQKELYPFQTEDLFKFVSVNVDTFSQPHKWEPIVEWANSDSYMLVIDEATVIKNVTSKRSQRLLYSFNDIKKRGKTIVSSVKKHPVRAVLTGTPVTNGPIDLWAIMEFVRPNYFGRNYYSFRAYFGMFTRLVVETIHGDREVDVLLTENTWRGIHDCANYDVARVLFGCSEDTYMTVKHQDRFMGPYKHADELKGLLEPVASFKKLTDCVSMPSVNYIVRKVDMSPAQAVAYDNMRQSMLARYGGYQTTASSKLTVSVRLQQISSGFIIGRRHSDVEEEMFVTEDESDERDIEPNDVVWLGDSNPKLDALMRDVAECAKPLIIMTRYSAEAAKIFELCEKAGYKTGLFTGWKVVGGVDAFKEGELDILVANSFKVSRGFNLQVAHTTLFYSNTFSMETRQQAEFRTFRMGQRHPCVYIDYSCSDVDDTINRALSMKKGLLEYIRDKDMEAVV